MTQIIALFYWTTKSIHECQMHLHFKTSFTALSVCKMNGDKLNCVYNYALKNTQWIIENSIST